MTIAVQATPIDPGALTNELTARVARQVHADQGAVVTFIGLVRDQVDNPVTKLFLEHYPGMTEKALATIAAEACARWPLGPLSIVHRVGTLYPGDPIVFVGVTSAHRKAAFEAAEFLLDYLKIRAPFWKKESTPNGEHWVSARASDCEAAKKWG